MAQGASGLYYYWRRADWCANSSGAGGIGAPIYWRIDVPLRQ